MVGLLIESKERQKKQLEDSKKEGKGVVGIQLLLKN
jgi:hypothetical protein